MDATKLEVPLRQTMQTQIKACIRGFTDKCTDADSFYLGKPSCCVNFRKVSKT